MEENAMSNYRIYLAGTQTLWSFATWPSREEAEQHIATINREHTLMIGRLEARPDLDPITVSHGLPEGEKE
jgi:hypothetical protein